MSKSDSAGRAPHRFRSLAATGAVAALALTGCTGEDPEPSPSPAPESSTAEASPTPTPTPTPTSDEIGFADIPGIIDEVQPSVVTIFTESGLGSGVIYSNDGLILTNEHVVGDARDVEIGFADGQRVAGLVVATDPVTDLALVQADRNNLPAADFQTDLPEVGELAVVIGSPLGFENSASAGIISGLHREIPGSATNSQSLVDLIQTDAAISPGNSGGAVVNGQGEVVGISEAYIPPQSGAVSLGFAIPAATAVEVAEELIEDGSAEHAYLGLVPRTLTPQIAEQLGVEQESGVVVLSVGAGTPAAEAGIEPGDLLVSLNGEPLENSEDLLAALRQLNPGDTVEAQVIRNGGSLGVEIELGERPTDEDS
ncbi:S1C family serine protease [Arthrobacter monumenti]